MFGEGSLHGEGEIHTLDHRLIRVLFPGHSFIKLVAARERWFTKPAAVALRNRFCNNARLRKRLPWSAGIAAAQEEASL